jgi:ubiquinol-cytochrome c reductase cytochrome b subunit
MFIIRRKSAVINILNLYFIRIKILITQRLNSSYLNTIIIHDKNHELNTDNPIYAYIVGLFEGDG